MHRDGFLPALLSLFLAAGCATQVRPVPPAPRVSGPFKPAALVTQRGVLTVHGRQFTLNGYLAESGAGARRLILTENFGTVLADVLVQPDGTLRVMRSSRRFRPTWIRRYVAADLQCLARHPPIPGCPVRKLGPAHYRIERRSYQLDLQTVETRIGPQPAALFDQTQEAIP